MDTIIAYLNNVFATLPNTVEMNRLKEDLLANMEDKYEELKREGKSGNEAIGIVISEFGNIDELVKELDLDLDINSDTDMEDQELSDSKVLHLTDDQVDDYLEDNNVYAKLIGLGTTLCILAPATLVFFYQFFKDTSLFGLSEDSGAIVGLVPLFLLLAVAVGMFIYGGMMMEKHKYLTNHHQLPASTKLALEHDYEIFQSSYKSSIITGVMLCILSPVFIIVLSAISRNAAVYGVVLLLVMIAIAIYLFTTSGIKRDAFDKLFKKQDGVK